MDRQFAELLHERATPALTYLFEAISSLGSSRTLALVALFAVVLLLSRRRLLDALLVIVALVGAEVMDAAVKAGFERERPLFDDPIVRRAAGFSFPSAHAGASMALYGALAFLLARDSGQRPRASAASLQQGCSSARSGLAAFTWARITSPMCWRDSASASGGQRSAFS